MDYDRLELIYIYIYRYYTGVYIYIYICRYAYRFFSREYLSDNGVFPRTQKSLEKNCTVKESKSPWKTSASLFEASLKFCCFVHLSLGTSPSKIEERMWMKTGVRRSWCRFRNADFIIRRISKDNISSPNYMTRRLFDCCFYGL